MHANTPVEFQSQWERLLEDYSSEYHLCRYLQDIYYTARTKWASAWTSHDRHTNLTTSPSLLEIHQILETSLATSTSDLRCVVKRLANMVQSQYKRCNDERASSKQTKQRKYTEDDIQLALSAIAPPSQKKSDTLDHVSSPPSNVSLLAPTIQNCIAQRLQTWD